MVTDCSHVWGVEFLIRLWEQNNENWYCNSTIYCTSIPENFPNTTDDVTGSKVTYLKRYHLILHPIKGGYSENINATQIFIGWA